MKSESYHIRICSGQIQRIQGYVGTRFLCPSDRYKEREEGLCRFQKKVVVGRIRDVPVLHLYASLRQCGKCQGSREKGEVDSSSAGSGRDSDNHGQTIFVNGTFYGKEVNRAADRVYSARTFLILSAMTEIQICPVNEKIQPLGLDFLFFFDTT